MAAKRLWTAQKKQIKKDKVVSLSVKHDANALRKRHRPFEANKNLNELMFSLSNTIKEENSYSDALYKARGHFKYKGVIQVFNLMLLIEAWGNLPKNEAINFADAMEYAANLVTTMGDTFYKGINTLELTRKIAAGYREGLVTSSLAKATLPIAKVADFTEAKFSPNVKFADIADILGTGLCFILGTLALLQSYEEFQKGRSKKSLMRLTEAAGCFTLSAGHLLGKTSSKITEKIAQRVLQREFAKRLALFILPGASIVVSVITLYDIYRTVVHYLKAPLYHVFDGYWSGFEKSTFAYDQIELSKKKGEYHYSFSKDVEFRHVRVKKTYAKDLYFNPTYAADGIKHAYQTVNQLMNDVTKNGFLSWRAVVPMDIAGYSVDAIKDFIKIDVTPKDMEAFLAIKDVPKDEWEKELSQFTEEILRDYPARKKINARGIMDFYKIISNPYSVKETFSSG